MVKVSSWGRLGSFDHTLLRLDRDKRLPLHQGMKGLSFGNGRSYGDICLNPNGILWSMQSLQRFIAFDDVTGILKCEAGVFLRDIQQYFVPRGWMLPVTPGTQLATLGGAIANDVHGKNHHAFGSFGDHVLSLRLLRTNGDIVDCGPLENADWFKATVGGMGLTGAISQAQIQLRKVAGPWLEAENIPFNSLRSFFELADQSKAAWEHTVSWIDCVSSRQPRGIFMRANHSSEVSQGYPNNQKKTMHIVPPISLVNRLTLKPFNFVYYHLKTLQQRKFKVHYEPFFYPLDNILEWNKMYGPRGFYQYQSVVPRLAGERAISAMLKEIAHLGEGSFLAVLKTFGDRQPVGMLSFPQPGITLALDFPNRGARTLALFDTLNSIVRQAGGRIYAAKDACMPPELFVSGYPKLSEFQKYRDHGISSAMSRRLMGS